MLTLIRAIIRPEKADAFIIFFSVSSRKNTEKIIC